jgi:protein TonB
VVRAQIKVANGVVTEVTVVSGPQVFHDVVTNAVKQYKCISGPEEVVATQEFVFKVDERAERKVRYVTVPNGPIFNLIQNQKKNLNRFSVTPKEGDASISIPTCRLSTIGVVDLQGKSSAEFISDAINLELLEAGLFSPQFFLKISIDALDFSSTLGAYWNFKVTITNPFGASVTIEDRFQFKAGTDGASSCDNVTLAFIPAVRELIFKILSNKDMKKLIPDKAKLN